MTDRELLSIVQGIVVEPVDGGDTWPSGLWSRAEVLQYLNGRQQRFLKETLAVIRWDQYPITPGQVQQPLPQDCLAVRDVFFVGTATPTILQHLSPMSRREVDLLQPTWEYSASPQPVGYQEDIWQTRQLVLVPLPQQGGELFLFMAHTGTVCTGDAPGVALTIPDECTPYLVYGVLADMFGQQGRAFDPVRRDYCEARWAEGIALTQAMLAAITLA